MKLFGLLLIPVLLFGSCSSTSEQGMSLLLSIEQTNNSYAVSGYELLQRPYIKSSQQGQFQAHLLNNSDKIIQKISFDPIGLPTNSSTTSGGMQVIIPATGELQTVNIYRLDGSSGHYQLNATKPLVSWTLPDSTKQKISANNSL
jgi:hypothetical protein